MRKITLKSLLIVALAVLPVTIFAQEEQLPTSYWTIGIEGGATQLFGDNHQWDFNQTSWNAGLFFGYTVRNQIYMYGNVGYSNLKGENKNFFTIDECNFLHANLNIGYDVLQLFRLNPHRKLAIVPHWGFGIMQHKTTIKLADGSVIKNGYSDSGKGTGLGGRRNVFQNAFGINFIFNFTKHFQANIDFVGYKTDSDYLDAIGGAGHNKHNDWYGHANIGLAYKFGVKDARRCPECPEVAPATPDCDACKDAIREAVEEALQNYQPAPVEAEEEEVEEVEAAEIVWEDKDIHLTFKVGKAEVANTQANNEEADKVGADLNAGRDITVVRSVGYASPEGNEDQNVTLAQERAEATSQFIQNRLGEQAEGITFEAEGMGSDWDGFYAALANSNIAAKDEIANQIKNSEDPTGTLNQLRVKYPELNEILNSLRRTQVFVK